MGACGYVPPDVRLKQEIVELTIELEAMGKAPEFCRLVLEEDILHFFDLQNEHTEEASASIEG